MRQMHPVASGVLIASASFLSVMPGKRTPDRRSSAERAAGRPWRKWYLTPAWRQNRATQLARHPWCVRCWAMGKQVRASVADHVAPHRGDAALFWQGRLQSLCMACHSSDKAHIELHGYSTTVGIDGWPMDSRHYANTGRIAKAK